MTLLDTEDDNTITTNCNKNNNRMTYAQVKDAKLRTVVTPNGEKYSQGNQRNHMEEQRKQSRFEIEPEITQDKPISTNGRSTAAQATADEQQPVREPATVNFQDSSPSLLSKTEARLLSLQEIRAGREARAGEALRFKDEQLRILQGRNATLLASLDKVEEETTQMQRDHLAVEEVKCLLQETLAQSQTQERAIKASLERAIMDNEEKDKQLHIMTSQNAELLRLLEVEEEISGKLSVEKEAAVAEFEDLKSKYRNAVSKAKKQEELAGKSSREGQLLSEEARLLKVERNQLLGANAELHMKAEVELESLQEALSVRKKKHYQLLERLQTQENIAREAEDRAAGLEESLKDSSSCLADLEMQLRIQEKKTNESEEAYRALLVDLGNEKAAKMELQSKVGRSENECLRTEAEARDSADQLSEMAEKVFQLLERLKLSERAKNKALETLRNKDGELISYKKKHERLIKESEKESRIRIKAEAGLATRQEEVVVLKKHAAQLSVRCKDEAKLRVKEREEKLDTQEKIKTFEGRITFLLNKVQLEEDARTNIRDESKKMEVQLKALTLRGEELQRNYNEARDSNVTVTQALKQKQEELDEITMQHEALTRRLKQQSGEDRRANSQRGVRVDDLELPFSQEQDGGGYGDAPPVDPEVIHKAGGRGVFSLESKHTQGLILVKSCHSVHMQWLKRHDINGFLQKAQRHGKFKELVIEKLCQICALLMAEEMRNTAKISLMEEQVSELRFASRSSAHLQEKLALEEDAKRHILIRYINAVKVGAATSAMQTATAMPALLKPLVAVSLPKAGMGDEEVHAIAAVLRGDTSVSELVLRGNYITDDGTRALAALLSNDSSGLRFVDLRENRISKQGMKALADALERSKRVRHVYVHENGKIEAMGTDMQELSGGGGGEEGGNYGMATKSNVPMVKVETVCIVDLRNNNESQEQTTAAGNRTVKSRNNSEATVDAPMLSTSRTTSSTKDGRNKVKKATKGSKSFQLYSASGKSNKRLLVNVSRSQDQLPMLPVSPRDNAAVSNSLEKKSAIPSSQINKGQRTLASGFKQGVRAH